MKEAWAEYYTKDELAEIQKIELESLDVFSETCKKLNIDFFLYGGSLLGAVKYGGYVPWDDDLDVALVRKDYEKLLREGPALLPEGYELQEPRNNKRTPYPYAKLRRSNTTMVEYMFRNVKINHGVYFDIYPIDNLPNDDEELEKTRKKILKLTFILQRKQTASLFEPIKGWKSGIRQLIFYGEHILYQLIPHQLLVKTMNSIMTKYNYTQTHRQGNFFYPEPVNYFNGIYPPEEIMFEGRKMLIPKGYEINLKNRYGDITEDPAEEDRVGHRPYLLKLD